MENSQSPNKQDDTLKGMIVIGGVLVILIGFMVLLSRQNNSSQDCTPTYNPDGTVLTGCSSAYLSVTPTPDISVEILDQLNENNLSEVDKRLQEAAEDLRNQQKAQQKSQQQQHIPPLPQQ